MVGYGRCETPVPVFYPLTSACVASRGYFLQAGVMSGANAMTGAARKRCSPGRRKNEKPKYDFLE